VSSVDDFYVWHKEYLDDIELNGPKKRRGRKPSKRLYFTIVNEKAIIAFNFETDQAKRNKVYREYIDYPFNKLVENIIHTFKFYYFDVPYEDVKAEVVAFLNEKITKFQEGKGKAFSYFSIIAKNYLIIANNTNYAKMKQKADITAIDDKRDLDGEQALSDHQESIKEFTKLYVEWYDKNINIIFTNRKDIIVSDTILELFRTCHNIENFNKKSLYILIRERTGLKTQNITKVINVMKYDYAKMFTYFQTTGRFRYIKD